MRAVEDVVAERQGDPVGSDELASDNERLRESIRARLRGVLDLQADLGAVAEQPPEAIALVWRGDDEDVADTREHQVRQRVVHHRLVVDRDELLADRARQRMQTRARATGEDDALQHTSTRWPRKHENTKPNWSFSCFRTFVAIVIILAPT